MTPIKHIPDKARSNFSLHWERISKRLPPKSFLLLALTVTLLSALAATDFSPRTPLLTEGEVATEAVVADASFFFRDKAATTARQDAARKMQPLIADLNLFPVDSLRDEIHEVFRSMNEAQTPEAQAVLSAELAERTGLMFSQRQLEALASPGAQNAVTGVLLPFVEQRLRTGILPDLSLARDYPGGIIVRNPVTGEGSLHEDAAAIPDIQSLKFHLSQQIASQTMPPAAKEGAATLFDGLIRPTLVPDFAATGARADAMAQSVTPVMYRVQRGEAIVQQGDLVTREQQLKMQVMSRKKAEPFKPKMFLGIALCGLLIASGLLFSPSSRAVSPMHSKDFVFLSILLTVFSLIAKGLAAHGAQVAAVTLKFLPESLAYAVPIAGAAALSSQIFSTRRYLVTGMLLAYFCTLMMGGGLPLFLFYFLSAMWSTWLTSRGTSRQEVVWSLLPLTLGLVAMWGAATMMQGGAHTRYFSELVAVMGGALLSMILTFALTPVIEMTFRYTTRFRLMELLNLEQPLLRELMLTAPGTYHHSLIVSNMCEAGAKRVGAHSLLCKVAALYHDIGKLSKAGYFIENQSTEDNPHNRLSPSMSALILTSHVKLGVELAKQHRLGLEVTNIICQHHGTNVIQYFYRKALNQTDAAPPNIEDFRYPGPRPQSKEAALVMLADIVEASSRTLDEPTPTRLRQHIDTIMKSVYATGQLDDSELTFKDLDMLADSFQQMMRGLYHHRISYNIPSGKDKGKPAAGAQGSTGKNVAARPPASTVPQ